MATVAYVAPELVTDGHADPRTDVYSAGVVLFEMLTGRVPYEGDRPVDVAWQHVDRDMPPPSQFTPGVPDLVDDLVARATRRDPGRRPTDAGALLTEVQAAREEIGVALAARARPLAGPTVAVPHVGSVPQTGRTFRTGELGRPSWARLPSGRPQLRPHPRPAARPGGGVAGLLTKVNAHPRGRFALAAALLTVGLLVAIGGWWFGVGRYTEAPNLTGMAQSVAQTQAKTAGFKLKYDDGEFSDTVTKGTVIRQRPGPGGRIVAGGTITLTVSRGPEIYQVPNIAGRPYDLVVEDLQNLRLKIVKADKFDDNVPVGSVVDTNPAVGTVIKPGAQITVYVSKGPNPVKVPNVVGRNVEEAKQILAQAKIAVGPVTEADSNKPKGEVISQDPPDGVSVTDGMVVKLVISKGPQQVPVPDVRDRQAQEAQQILQQAGLTSQVVGFGTVRQQNPPPGTPVPPGSTVTLFCFG
jgi:serine/threonine-protein kinase